MTTIRVAAESLRAGDVIMPPPREVNLWMRRDIQARRLPETALYLTITDVKEGNPDKGGRWLIISANHTPEWNEGKTPRLFIFKVRPVTPWQKAA
jgi:hypothetical protein